MYQDHPDWPLAATLFLFFTVIVVGCTVDGSPSVDEAGPQENPYETPVSNDLAPIEISAPLNTPPAALPSEDNRNVAERLQDASLATRVRQALVARRVLRLYDFDVEVMQGVVYLQGHVESASEKQLAERVAAAVEDVDELVSMLTTSEPLRAEGSQRISQNSGVAHHVVQPGESLWHIARSHNVRVEDLKELNGMTSNSIQPGDRLRVR